MELRNNTNLEFKTISNQSSRTYVYGDGFALTIDNPTHLNEGEKGDTLLDEKGVCHFLPAGFRYVSWKPKEGQPQFV